MLEGLTQDVDVTALVSRVEEAPVRELLDRYAYESKRFRVEYADPNERPRLIEQLKIESGKLGEHGVVHVALGGESVNVEQIDEPHVTNALVKLTRTGEKVVYFVQGHGEDEIEGKDAASRRDAFTRAAEALRNENYHVQPLLLAQVKDVPEDADVVIVAGGRSQMFEEEVAALDRYFARGGALMALVDPRQSGRWVEKLRAWGADLGNDIVIDAASNLFGAATTTPFAGQYDPEQPITRSLRDPRNDPTIFPETRSVSARDGAALKPIVYTGDQSWAERDLVRLESGHVSKDPGDLAGPVPVMVAGTPSLAAKEGDAGKARIVVVGDTAFASNEFIDAGRNRDLFLNAANWLIGDVAAISVRPNRSRASRFQLTADQFHAIRSASLFILPEAIAVLGVFTWWSRRNPAA